MEKCLTEDCKNLRSKKSRYCGTCRSRTKRANNPMGYAYKTMKNNAKRRGKEWNLSFDDFKAFCEKNDYMKRKGRTFNALTIDRIDNSKGYEAGNIQAITQSKNISKDWENSELKVHRRTGI